MNGAARVAGDRVGQQTQNRMRGDGFARAAFAYQRQGFTATNIEADVLDHPLPRVARHELDRQIADFDQIVIVHLISLGRMHRGRIRR